MLTRESARARDVSILIQTVKGEMSISITPLTVSERTTILESVPDPQPEKVDVIENGVKVTKVNDKDEAYLNAVNHAINRRNARMIMMMLIKAGHFKDMEDATLEELEAYAMSELDPDLWAGVLSAVVQIRSKLAVSVQSVKENF